MANFYIVNALGQNLANSESYPILRLLYEAKICNFREFVIELVKHGHFLTFYNNLRIG